MNTVIGRSSLVVGKTNLRDENIAISNRTRWIAAATGCVTALVGLPVLSLLSPILSGCLVVGAALAGRSPRYGRDLMWFGAGTTSLLGVPIGLFLLRLSLQAGRDERVAAVILVSLPLLLWCDAALIKEAFSQRRTTNDQRRS